MSQTFVKRQNVFDAIQFTGGEENAKKVGKWLFERFELNSTYQRHTNRADGSERGEVVLMNRRERLTPGDWATQDSEHGDLQLFSEKMFSKLFVPKEDLEPDSVGEEKFDGACEQSEDLTTPVEKFEVDGLFSFGGVLHGRRADNGNFVPIVVLDGKPTQIENAGEAEVGADYILDQTKYNEDTLKKVMDALNVLMVRVPYTNSYKFHERVTTNDVIGSLQNAGILFREAR